MSRRHRTILILAFNRSASFQRLWQSLSQCIGIGDWSVLISIDGPRDSNDHIEQQKILEWIDSHPLEALNTTIRRQSANLGLAEHVIEAVTHTLRSADYITVLEDDLILHEKYLKAMQKADECYHSDHRVGSVHGFTYPIPNVKQWSLVQAPVCWGWSTWSRAWNNLNTDVDDHLEYFREPSLQKEFNISDQYPYYQLLLNHKLGINSSWAVLWYASMIRNELTVLQPPESLVTNQGFEGNGTHCHGKNPWKSPMMAPMTCIALHPHQEHIVTANELMQSYAGVLDIDYHKEQQYQTKLQRFAQENPNALFYGYQNCFSSLANLKIIDIRYKQLERLLPQHTFMNPAAIPHDQPIFITSRHYHREIQTQLRNQSVPSKLINRIL